MDDNELYYIKYTVLLCESDKKKRPGNITKPQNHSQFANVHVHVSTLVFDLIQNAMVAIVCRMPKNKNLHG